MEKAGQKRLTGWRLTIHAASRLRPVAEGISFLGFVFYPQRCRQKRFKFGLTRSRRASGDDLQKTCQVYDT